MNSHAPSFRGYRFPPDIISHAIWFSYRVNLSFRDVEDLLAERGVTVTYEAIRRGDVRLLGFGRDWPAPDEPALTSSTCLGS